MSDFGLRGRYVVRITPADIGSRVSVRARTGEDVEGPQFTDTLGTLEYWEDGVLWIRRRDGRLSGVNEGTMVAGKTLPPAPEPRNRRS